MLERAAPSPTGAEVAGPAAPSSGRVFAGCGFALFALFCASNAPSPLYRVYAERFGFGPLVITLVFSVYMAVIIPSLLLFGPLSDAVGRRAVVVPGLLAAVVGALAFAAAEGTGWLFAARAVQGLSMGVCSGALTAAMVEHEPRGEDGRAVVTASMCVVAGTGTGPLLAGALAEWAPWPRVLAFLLLAVALLVAVLVVLPLGRATTRAPWRPRRPQVPRAIAGPFGTAAASSFLAWAVTGLFLSLVPSYALALADSSNLALAGGVVAELFAASGLAQRVARRVDAGASQRAGLAALVIGVGLLVAAGELRLLPLLFVATGVAGAGQGLAFAGSMAQVGGVAPVDRRADVMSSFYVITYVGTAGPVIGVGLLARSTGLLRAVEVFAAVLTVACALALLRLARTPGGAPGRVPAPGRRVAR